MRSIHGLDLFLVFLAHLYAVYGACVQEKVAILACEAVLSTAVNQRLASQYGLTNVGTEDLQNTTIEHVTRSTRDVICNTTNKESVDCVFNNPTSCNMTSLVQEADFRSGLFGYIVSSQWDEIKAAPSACEALETRACDLMKPRLNSCGIDLFGTILDGRELTRKEVCLASHSSINCIIEITKECYWLVEQGNAANVRKLILQDKWNLFSDATKLCDCYSGVECWDNTKSAISNQIHSSSSPTVKEVYENTLDFSQNVCRNKANLKCAHDRVATCQSVDSLHHNAELSMLFTMSNEMCTAVGSDAFSTNKECIVNRLVNPFHPCISRAKLPKTGITTCGQLNVIYTCVHDALDSQCNLDVQEAMFTMLRGDNYRLTDCTLTVSTASIFHQNILLHTLAVFTVIKLF